MRADARCISRGRRCRGRVTHSRATATHCRTTRRSSATSASTPIAPDSSRPSRRCRPRRNRSRPASIPWKTWRARSGSCRMRSRAREHRTARHPVRVSRQHLPLTHRRIRGARRVREAGAADSGGIVRAGKLARGRGRRSPRGAGRARGGLRSLAAPGAPVPRRRFLPLLEDSRGRSRDPGSADGACAGRGAPDRTLPGRGRTRQARRARGGRRARSVHRQPGCFPRGAGPDPAGCRGPGPQPAGRGGKPGGPGRGAMIDGDRPLDRVGSGTRPDVPELPASLHWVNVRAPARLADLRGRVTLLFFWNGECIDCANLLAELRQLERRHPGVLALLGVHTPRYPSQQSDEAVLKAAHRHRLRVPVANDAHWLAWRQFGITAWPSTLLIDAAGRLAARLVGAGRSAELDEAIALLREEPAAAESAVEPRPLRELRPEPRTPLAFPAHALATASRLYVSDSG